MLRDRGKMRSRIGTNLEGWLRRADRALQRKKGTLTADKQDLFQVIKADEEEEAVRKKSAEHLNMRSVFDD